MKILPKPPNISPFVHEILLLENHDGNEQNHVPLYADGFAGIAYSKSENPFFMQPKNKQLSDFYLFGQNIHPIALEVKGNFRLIALRLYPFAIRILLNINPKTLNDDCYDLRQLQNIDTENTIQKLHQLSNQEEILNILVEYFEELLKNASNNPDYRIKLATSLILKSNGKISIKEVRDRLCVTERTLERHFLKEMGVTAKQFAKIIQFNSSIKQITEADYINLTDIAYDNGFADQSHFIRTFKKFTGKTPKEFQNQLI